MSIRQRALIGTVASVGVVGTSLGVWLAQGPEHAATEVQVEDTAEVIHEQGLLAGVEGVRFHEPTTVAVFTHRGGTGARYNDFALNNAVLAHARETRTDWLSADEQKWADDLYIFAVDPEGRLVGTYFGENRKVDEEAQLEIQDATKDDLRAGRWTEGSVAGVEAAAKRMNSPLVRTTGGTVTAGGVSLVTLLVSGGYLGAGLSRRRQSRRARAEGDRAMASVVRDYEVTELHARLLPEGTRYGGLVLRRYDDYRKGFRQLTDLGNEVRSIPEKDYDTPEALKRLTAYQERAVSLDHLDDVIAATAALLNRDRAWIEAWRREEEPVREELEAVETLLTSDLDEELRGLSEGQELRTFASQELVELDRLRDDLEHQRITPDDALDRLRRSRDQLSGHLDALASAVAREVGKDADERALMAKGMRAERSSSDYGPTIIGTAHPGWTWYGVSSFRDGYTSGTREVEQSRSPSSSGGSSSGYSSGGSFSGAGSSSRF